MQPGARDKLAPDAHPAESGTQVERPLEPARRQPNRQATTLGADSAPTSLALPDAQALETLAAIGVDIGKQSLQFHGVDANGACLFRLRAARDEVLGVMQTLPRCRVGMEPTIGATYWAQAFCALGYDARIIPLHHLQPFAPRMKNDRNDARMVAQALLHPEIGFAVPRTPERFDIQLLHRIRRQLVEQRLATINQLRSFLLDRGHDVPLSDKRDFKRVGRLLSDPDSGLGSGAREALGDLYRLTRVFDAELKAVEARLADLFHATPACQRIATIPGIGMVTAIALYAALGDGTDFRNGRHFAAWLGLVPRQRSSRERLVLGRISKRGDQQLRTLLFSATLTLLRPPRGQDPLRTWVRAVRVRRGAGRARIAAADKVARISWHLVRHEEIFDPSCLEPRKTTDPADTAGEAFGPERP